MLATRGDPGPGHPVDDRAHGRLYSSPAPLPCGTTRKASYTPSTRLTADRTWARWEMSASSKVKRSVAIRARPVATVADTVLTWWSERTSVMSRSSLVRSSASTWMVTANTEGPEVSQVT